MHNITAKITVLMFLSIAATVFLLVYLANLQMESHIHHYLLSQHSPGGGLCNSVSGGAEETLLSGIHQSLYAVGALLLFPALFASYLLARSITVPLRKLAAAATDISRGQYGRRVTVEDQGDLGRLSEAFNSMSASLERQLNHRRQFLAAVAHDLKTPLAILRGNLEGMADGLVDPSPANLHSLCEETDHLNRLITDLRDLSLAEAGQLALEKSPVDITGLIVRAANMLEPLCQEKGLALTLRVEADLPSLTGDRRRMNQMLYNLLTNAIRHTPPGGRIAIEAKTAAHSGQSGLEMSVLDTGSGISAADLPHIFDLFYRSDPSRDKRSGGSGIGLAIVKQLAELHGGCVTASSAPGAGSRFTVWLPFHAADVSNTAAKPYDNVRA